MQKIAKYQIINYFYYLVILLIVGFGLFLRIKQYIGAYPLFDDEMALHFDFYKRPFSYFFGLLDRGLCQIHPPLFLCAVKFMTLIFGDNLYSLRLISLLSGCMSLVLFFLLLNKTFKSKIPIITALFIFAVNGPLIEYSAEFKAYSNDVFVLLLIFLFYEKINLGNIRSFIFWLFMFFLLPFLSFTSLVALGAVLLLKIVDNFKGNENFIIKRNNFFKIVLLAFTLLISAVSIFKINYQNTIGMIPSHFEGYLYPSVKSFFNLIDTFIQYLFYDTFQNIKDNAYFLNIFFFSGIILTFFSKNKMFKLYLFSIILLLIAAYLQVYPLKERMSLYITPVIILFITSTLECKEKSSKLDIIKSLLLVIFLFGSLYISHNLPRVLDKNFTLWYDVELRRTVKNEFIDFLKIYNNGQKLITSNDILIIHFIEYYNKVINYNKDLNFIDIGDNLEEYIKNNINESFYIVVFIDGNKEHRLTKFSGFDNVYNYDIKDIIDILNKNNIDYKILETSAKNILYINPKESR